MVISKPTGAESDLHQEFARRVKLLGFPDFDFHHFRGTHASLLLDRGVPVHTVAEWIGVLAAGFLGT